MGGGKCQLCMKESATVERMWRRQSRVIRHGGMGTGLSAGKLRGPTINRVSSEKISGNLKYRTVFCSKHMRERRSIPARERHESALSRRQALFGVCEHLLRWNLRAIRSAFNRLSQTCNFQLDKLLPIRIYSRCMVAFANVIRLL